MTNMEKIKEAESMMLEATKLMESAKKLIKESKTSSGKDTLIYEYTKNFGTDCSCWYLDSMGDIIGSSSISSISDIPKNEFNYFNNFWNTEYAKKSRELIQFNNKLLAFKWCWDRDYEPDWDDFHSEHGSDAKFYVYFDSNDYKYRCGYCHTHNHNSVFFSSGEIAQKCCDWLNSMEES